jgi:primosomal protein N' (replication factor Y)
VSLTYHEVEHALICHHCGRRQPVPARCPECGSPYLRKFGAGTQRVESELKALLEGRDVPVIRMDSDTTSTRNAHEELLKRFARPGASVLLGTQMIAKGLDFDEVTLVGVINADTQLKLPDFRSAERTFDLIQQVAGRAGRGVFAGKVYVQTYVSESVAVQAAAHYDRKRFLIDELPKRKMLRYPPYARIADVLVWGHDAQEVQKAAQALAQRVEAALRDNGGEGWVSFGAAPCLLSKIRNMYRWHILVKAPAGADVSAVLSPVMRSRKASKTVNVACDVDPLSVL